MLYNKNFLDFLFIFVGIAIIGFSIFFAGTLDKNGNTTDSNSSQYEKIVIDGEEFYLVPSDEEAGENNER